MLILFITAGSSVAEDINIDAKSMEGTVGGGLIAEDAILNYKDIKLEAKSLSYDPKAGWIKANEGAKITDSAGNTMSTSLLEYFPTLSKAIARGDVEFELSSGQKLWANLIRFELEQNRVFLEGKIRYQDPKGFMMIARDLEYSLAKEVGIATKAEITSENSPGTLTASLVKVSPTGFALEGATFTSCDINDPDWFLSADSIELDVDGVATAKGVKLQFFGVPLLNVSQLAFSTSKKRKSGFLSPRVEIKSGGDYGIEIPFYLNLAPNYDAIIKPRLISGRGVFTTTSGRWLFKNAAGDASVGLFLGNDDDEVRGSIELDHQWSFKNNVQIKVAGQWLSDDAVAEDFLSGDIIAQRQFPQEIEISHKIGSTKYGITALHHRTIYDPVATITTTVSTTATLTTTILSYEKEPQIKRAFDSMPSLWLTTEKQFGNYNLMFENSLNFFSGGHAIATISTTTATDNSNNVTVTRITPVFVKSLQDGYRYNAKLLLDRSAWLKQVRFDYKLGVDGSYYEYRNEAQNKTDASWLVPHASVDISKKFSSDFSLQDYSLTQIIEPRLFLSAVKKTDFSNVLLYDTTRIEQNTIELFQTNSFVGGDRFENSSLMTYGFSTQWWRNDFNREVLSAQIAQQYRLSRTDLNLPNQLPIEKGFSNVVLELAARPTKQNALKVRLDWNPDVNRINQLEIEAKRKADINTIYSIRYARNISEKLSNDKGKLSLGLYSLFATNWKVTSDITYDFEDDKLTKSTGGLRYISKCKCWSLDMYFEREPLNSGHRTTYYFQIDLSGLGEFGSDRFDIAVDKLRNEL